MAYILLHILLPFQVRSRSQAFLTTPKTPLLYKAKLSRIFCLTFFCEFSPLSQFQGWVAIFGRIRGTNLDNVGQECDHENIRLLLMFGQSDFLIQPGLAKSELGYPPSFLPKAWGGNRILGTFRGFKFSGQKIVSKHTRLAYVFSLHSAVITISKISKIFHPSTLTRCDTLVTLHSPILSKLDTSVRLH